MYYGYYPWEPGAMAWGWPIGSPYFMPGMSGMGYPSPYPGGFGMGYPSYGGSFGVGYPPPYPGGFGAPGMSPFGGPPMGPDQEIEFLKSQADMLRQHLDQINARVTELEKIGQ